MKNKNNLLKISMLMGTAMLLGFVAPYSPSRGPGVGQTTSDWEAPAEAKELKNPVTADADSLKNGKELYKTNCVMCHGENGAGDGPMAANLNPKPAPLSKETIGSDTDGELFWKISKGKLPMFAFEKMLTEKDRWHIVNYIRTF